MDAVVSMPIQFDAPPAPAPAPPPRDTASPGHVAPEKSFGHDIDLAGGGECAVLSAEEVAAVLEPVPGADGGRGHAGDMAGSDKPSPHWWCHGATPLAVQPLFFALPSPSPHAYTRVVWRGVEWARCGA